MAHSNRHEEARTGPAFRASKSLQLETVEQPNLNAALAYAKAGYRVLRVYGVRDDGTCRCHAGAACKTPGKHPVGKTGVKEASTDEGTIRKWFAGRPDFNVGIATGFESGIVVIDVDPRHGGDQSLIELRGLLRTDGGAAVRPIVQITGGGGKHLVFRHPGGKVANRNGVRPGIDIRGDVGYIVVAPSQHPSGGVYHWREGRSLLEFQPAEFPQEWRFLLNPRTGCGGVTKRTHDDPEYSRLPKVLGEGRREERRPRVSLTEAEIESLIERTLPPHKGTRHDSLFGLTRELKDYFGPDPCPALNEIMGIIRRWYGVARERDLTTGVHAVDECVERVLDTWPKVRTPGRSNPVAFAVEKALQKGDHPACGRLLVPSQFTRLLVGACAQLADQEGLFFLSCGDAAKALGDALGQPYEKTYADRSLKMMIHARVLEVVQLGESRRGGKATEYRFLEDCRGKQ